MRQIEIITPIQIDEAFIEKYFNKEGNKFLVPVKNDFGHTCFLEAFHSDKSWFVSYNVNGCRATRNIQFIAEVKEFYRVLTGEQMRVVVKEKNQLNKEPLNAELPFIQ